MDFDPSTHPHRRYNPLTGEYVLVSPHRNKRPWQGQTEPPLVSNEVKYDPNCYLCPGNARSGGQKNDDYTSTMVFENDFPAILSQAALPAVSPHPLLQAQTVQGACDVIVFHPRHDLTLPRLNLEEIKVIIKEWTKLYLRRGNQEGIKYVQIFENKGAMMGCSNPHPHCQAWSSSEIPNLPATELVNLRNFSQKTNYSEAVSSAPRGPNGKQCLLCEYAHYELSVPQDDSRVVFSNEHWVALVPYWAVWPFEIMLLPHHRHVPSLHHLTPQEITSFAQAISRLTIKYDNLFSTSFAYSMGIHQRPTPSLDPAVLDEDDIAHLHLHFNPPLLRSATVRKFLVGFELMGEPQRDLTAEQAAKRLRECSETHYLDANI